MKRIFILCVLLLSQTGCLLTPIIQGVSDLGVTEKDRQRLLNQEIKRFNEALFWGHPEQALAFVPEENREDVKKSISSHGRSERIVESKIDSLDFVNNSYQANVSIFVRYYKVPVYIVEERHEDQIWRFSVAGGWKLVSHQTTPG